MLVLTASRLRAPVSAGLKLPVQALLLRLLKVVVALVLVDVLLQLLRRVSTYLILSKFPSSRRSA